MSFETKIYTPTVGKAITLEQFNNDALWRDSYTSEFRDKQGEIQKSKRYKTSVATLYRCIDIRAGTISQVPYSIYKLTNNKEVATSNNFWSNPKFQWLSDFSRLMYLTEASILLTSEAFWLKQTSATNKTLGFRWLASPYISPVYDTQYGIIGFKRELNSGSVEDFSKNDIVYFYTQNPLGEIIPDMPQALSAAMSANVIFNYEKFIEEFYKRGAVRATILKVDRSVAPKERARLREFWQNFLSGTTNAYATEVISGDVSAEVIGEGAGDSEKTEVLRDRRKDIATGMGVPFSLLFGDSSASYTAGPTEEMNFLKYTIRQRVELIQNQLNEQFFIENGYRIRFFVEHMPAYKDFISGQFDMFKKLTDSLLPASFAAKLAGIVLPDDISYDDMDKFVAEERERQFREKERIVTLNSKIQEGNGNQTPTDPTEDNNMKSFYEEVKKFRKWYKNNKSKKDLTEFKSDLLTEQLKEMLLNG